MRVVVVPLPPGKNPFPVKINNNNNNNNNNKVGEKRMIIKKKVE
jgi:hypothetical protein